MNCQNCNQTVPDGAKYCPKCGSKIDIITEIVSIEPTTFPLNTDGLWLTSKDLTYRCKAKRSKGTLLYSEISKCEKRNFASWFMLDITTTENKNICLNIKKKDEDKLDQAVAYIKEHCSGYELQKTFKSAKINPTSGNNNPGIKSQTASFHLRGIPDSNGLYPSELVMLSVAEKYKTTEINFPGYLVNKYEVPNPKRMLKDLESRGYLEEATSSESLPSLNLNELKEIASIIGISKSGKKADIVSRLAEQGDDVLSQYVKERNWKLTESGRSALDASPYIQFFLDRHSYNLSEVDIDIWTTNQLFAKTSKRPYRDLIFGQLNSRVTELMPKLGAGSYESYKYCECRRIMALFVEEEGSYQDAVNKYLLYLYERINIHAGLSLLHHYGFIDDKEYRKELIDRYYEDIKLYPFHRTEIQRLIDKQDIPQSDVRDMMKKAFDRFKNAIVMNSDEAADFIIYELIGDIDLSRNLAITVAQKAVKKKKRV